MLRGRHPKPNPADFVVSTNPFQANEKENLIARNKHDRTQIVWIALTALVYLIHTLRAYIPETNSRIWSKLTIRPITRVYTFELRPSVVIENLLFRLAENWQTFSLLYVVSCIPRRTKLGYLYRYPNLFSSSLCFLLISALALQSISQSSISPAVSCGCLYASSILLIIICRIVAVKSYRNKYPSTDIDPIIVRYFVLNSLFLYTTSIAYSTMCATVEYVGIHLDPNATSVEATSSCTSIGLTIMFSLVLIYFLLDQLVYDNEFWSIWTPYLFIAYAFLCPSLLENTNHFNYYLLWTMFIFTILMISLRFYRQISMVYRQRRKKIRISSHIEQITTRTELH